jgi:hypothetical protein
MKDQIFVVDHNKFRRFNYINSPSANFQLGQIIINPKTNEIGVVIQTHSDDECRTDMFGNCDASEVGYATLQEIQEHRPELLPLISDYNQLLQDAAAQIIQEIENGDSDSLLILLKRLSIKDLKGFLPA